MPWNELNAPACGGLALGHVGVGVDRDEHHGDLRDLGYQPVLHQVVVHPVHVQER